MSINTNIENINNNFKILASNIEKVDYKDYENIKFKINKINSKLEELSLQVKKLSEDVISNKVYLDSEEKKELESQKKSEEIINIFESGGIPEMCKDCEISNNFVNINSSFDN